MSVEIVRESGDDLLEAINALVPQLSSSTPPLAAEDLNGLLSQQGTVLFVYRDEGSGAVLGMLTLATFDIPTGKRAWIEDVVVDGAARGQGAGYKLVEAAVQHALALGCKTVDLRRGHRARPPTDCTGGRVPASRNKRLPLRRMTPPTKGQLCVSVNRSLRASPV